MGLGKTFVGSEKMHQLAAKTNLIICQKSKINDWLDHLKSYYDYDIYDLTNKKQYKEFIYNSKSVGIINYELAFRRKELLKLKDFTLLLDESSLIQNEHAKRSKFILKMNPKNIILLSGTPTNGKYERLYSQLKLLGWNISKSLYWNQYIKTKTLLGQGFPIKIVTGYKNIDRLKSKLREHGAIFLKTGEVFDLPKQQFNAICVSPTKIYKTFKKHRIVSIGGENFVGDTVLTKLLYERLLCGAYSHKKLLALEDILQSTEDRVIIFYNFDKELRAIENICLELDKPTSIVNGHEKDLSMYNEYENSVSIIQYQAGSMGLNLQKANKMIYFTPPLSCEHWMQSAKRISRIGQNRSCFYYKLIVKDSVEEKIYAALERGVDYTNELFKMEI